MATPLHGHGDASAFDRAGSIGVVGESRRGCIVAWAQQERLVSRSPWLTMRALGPTRRPLVVGRSFPAQIAGYRVTSGIASILGASAQIVPLLSSFPRCRECQEHPVSWVRPYLGEKSGLAISRCRLSPHRGAWGDDVGLVNTPADECGIRADERSSR